MVFNWTQKSVWSGVYYLKDGERILWELDDQGRLVERLRHNIVQHGVIKERGTVLYHDDYQVEVPRLFTPHVMFNVREEPSNQVLVQTHLSCNILKAWFVGKTGYEMGYLLCQNGERFVFTSRDSHRLVELRSGDKYINILGCRSVETNMDMFDRLVAAVLLPGVLFVWKRGPFTPAMSS